MRERVADFSKIIGCFKHNYNIRRLINLSKKKRGMNEKI